MGLFLVAVVVMAGSALMALRWSRVGVWGAVAGSVIGVVPAVSVLVTGVPASLRMAWDVPYGAFHLELDALSALFLIPIFVLGALAAVYGDAYLGPRSHGKSWCFYNLLLVSMAIVVTARNGVLFLIAWETMALASFFLVTFEDEQASVREAGWTYLVASHLGTAFLLVMFVLLGNFDGGRPPGRENILFVLAVIGFGTKAGFWPLHVWLPEAHPAAPSHVSALMSGVMIKMGIYGLVRMLTLLGGPPAWWGWVLIGIGLSSGILGVLFALAQHDLKRLLAYHSVENIGIIALGLGVGLLGQSTGNTALTVLGFAGALLHVINHALFKGLLFLGAGAVLHGTGTRDIEHLGGLSKRMPWTAATFLIGAVAISGLPPLNGFVSEFLIYVGAYRGAVHDGPSLAVPMLALIAGLALIGGLAAACFTKAFGIVFLGEPRSEHAAHAHEPGWAMRLPMLALAGGCVVIGFGAPWVVRALRPAIVAVTNLPAERVAVEMAEVSGWLMPVVIVAAVFVLLVLALAGLRRLLLRGREVGTAVTWDCGYAQPTARMQYTASSFAQPLTNLFHSLLRSRRQQETPDVAREALFRPVFAVVEAGLARLRWLQHGRVHLYVLYIALTLVVLLVWKLR